MNNQRFDEELKRATLISRNIEETLKIALENNLKSKMMDSKETKVDTLQAAKDQRRKIEEELEKIRISRDPEANNLRE